MKRYEALQDIVTERVRQNHLKAEGRFEYTAADKDCPEILRLGMLVEELGEVARAVQSGHDAGDLRTELTQAAAICLAWLEALPQLEPVRHELCTCGCDLCMDDPTYLRMHRWAA